MISQKTEGNNTTVTFSYTGNTQKIVNGLTNAAIYLYRNGFMQISDTIDIDHLTNQEIGSIVDAYVLHTIKELAKSYYVQSQIEATRQEALEYGEDNLF